MFKKIDFDIVQGLDLYERKIKKDKIRESFIEKLRDIMKCIFIIEKLCM